MKVIGKIFFIALMIWTMYSISALAATAIVDTEGARLRNKASTDGEVVTIAYKGETVEILVKEGNWYKVKYNGAEGYVREDLLKLEQEVSIPENNLEEPEVLAEENTLPENDEQETVPEVSEEVTLPVDKQVNADIMVRIVPSLSATKIGDIKSGTKVTVIKIMNNWSCIKYNNKTAWIQNKYLEEVNSEVAEEQPEEETGVRKGYINVEGANVREAPSTEAPVLTSIGRNKEVEILAEEGSWYKVKLENHAGYISKSLVSSTPPKEVSRSMEGPRQVVATASPSTEVFNEDVVIKTVYVNTEVANLRNVATTSSEVVGTVKRKDALEVYSEENGWYKIKTVNGKAYILKSLVVDTLDAVVIPAPPLVKVNTDTSSSVGNGTSSSGNSVVDFAKKYLGSSYSYGGSGSSSFDCSGFTQYVYKQFGVSLAHSAVTQASSGVPVSKAELKLGDIIIFNDWDNRSIGHCGIFVGDGKFIHAANPSRGVVIDTFTSGYYLERYVTARRVI